MIYEQNLTLYMRPAENMPTAPKVDLSICFFLTFWNSTERPVDPGHLLLGVIYTLHLYRESNKPL